MACVIRIHGFSMEGNVCVVVNDEKGAQLSERSATHLSAALERVVKDLKKACGGKKILTLADVQHPRISTLGHLVCMGMSFRYWRKSSENLSLLYISKGGFEIDPLLETLLTEIAPYLNVSGVCSGESEKSVVYKVKRKDEETFQILSTPRCGGDPISVSYAGVGDNLPATIAGVSKIV